MESRSNLTSSPTSFRGIRMIREDLNLSSIDPPLDRDQIHIPGRLGLDLAVPEGLQRSTAADQSGIGFSDGLSNTAPQNYYCSGQVLESYILDSDLPASNQSRIDFSKPMSQLQGSLGNLNENVNDGFNVVAACSDNSIQFNSIQ